MCWYHHVIMSHSKVKKERKTAIGRCAIDRLWRRIGRNLRIASPILFCMELELSFDVLSKRSFKGRPAFSYNPFNYGDFFFPPLLEFKIQKNWGLTEEKGKIREHMATAAKAADAPIRRIITQVEKAFLTMLYRKKYHFGYVFWDLYAQLWINYSSGRLTKNKDYFPRGKCLISP